MVMVRDRNAQKRIQAEREHAAILVDVAKSELERICGLTSWHMLSPGAKDAFCLARAALRGATEAMEIVLGYTENEHVPFVELARLLRGKGAAALIDAEVGRWHAQDVPDAPQRDPAIRLGLHEWLGLTEIEYARWLKDPSLLDAILDARLYGSKR